MSKPEIELATSKSIGTCKPEGESTVLKSAAQRGGVIVIVIMDDEPLIMGCQRHYIA
jgi:hypothetical protein